MNITVKESIHIRASPERVWDYTQDWTRRTEWDPSIRAAEVLPGDERKVRAHTTAGSFLIRYKQFARPHRTSLAMTESTSRLVTGGGGSWDYTADEGGTRFTEQNTLVLRDGLIGRLLRRLFLWQLRRGTRKALENAKRRIEASSAPISVADSEDGEPEHAAK